MSQSMGCSDGRRIRIRLGLPSRMKLDAQRDQKALEQKRNKKRRELFDAQDQIDERRNELIEGIERQLGSVHSTKPLFTIRWRIT